MNNHLLKKIKNLQKNLASKVLCKNYLPDKIGKIAAVDVSYKGNMAMCAAVILDYVSLDLIKSTNIIEEISFSYVPGFFMLRESKPILHSLKKLGRNYDVLLIDGNGVLHPRQFGLACYVGLMVDKPVIGVAKNLLCGNVKDSKVYLKNRIVGYELNKNKKKFYVSVGHKIHPRTAVRIVKHITTENETYPRPLMIADKLSKDLRKKV